MNTDDLPFRDDFNTRVLDTAGAIARRRRYTRGAVAACAVLVLAGAGTLGALHGVRPSMPVTDNAPHLVTGFDTVASEDTQTESEYLFPETADLTKFSQNYAGTGAANDDEPVPFADDVEDDSGSSN